MGNSTSYYEMSQVGTNQCVNVDPKNKNNVILQQCNNNFKNNQNFNTKRNKLAAKNNKCRV